MIVANRKATIARIMRINTVSMGIVISLRKGFVKNEKLFLTLWEQQDSGCDWRKFS
jgi:hypothetical protein